MSFTKASVTDSILRPTQKIQQDTLNDNDLVRILQYLNTLMSMHEILCVEASKPFEKMWNEIINDAIAIIHESISGFYHTAQISLRSILEIACSSFFYYDHPVEYFLFEEENKEANTYVSILVNDYSFFRTKYIKAFCTDIETIETNIDSVSTQLKSTYKSLCDIVHGRFKTFTKTDKLEIVYSKSDFMRFEKNYCEVIGLIAALFALRFNHLASDDIKKIANASGVISL